MAVSTEARRGTAYVAALRQKLPNSVLEESWQTPDQVTVTVTREALPEAVETLYYGHDGWLCVVVGSDERKVNGAFAIYYVLSMEGAEKSFVVVRALVPPDTMEFPSVTSKVPAAVWGEREVRDMFGMRPIGLIDERRLVLPDDWPDDLHPLRKDAMDYRLRPELATESETYEFVSAAEQETTQVPLGPLHITSDEPGHFRLFVDGEDIIDADYRLFYVHRGMEKLAETRMGYDEVTFLADRICGICGFTHSVAYSEAVENALGVHAPPRAATIRTILLEVERLHSHLLNLGLACHFIGFDTGFMHLFRVREKSMELAELLTGSRKTYALNLIGGVRRDILAEQDRRTRQLLAELRTEVTRLVDILLSTGNIRQRLAGVGILDPKVARDYSPVGPTVRGSGHRRDVRVDHPYAAYAGVPLHAALDGRLRCAVAHPDPRPGVLRFDRHHRALPGQRTGRPDPHRGLHLYAVPLRARLYRGAARRGHPLVHARRQPEGPSHPLPRAELQQLAVAALHAARQHRLGRADRHRQHRPLLFLHRPRHRRRRAQTPGESDPLQGNRTLRPGADQLAAEMKASPCSSC